MKKAIFCVPGSVYKGLPEAEVARRYTRIRTSCFQFLLSSLLSELERGMSA